MAQTKVEAEAVLADVKVALDLGTLNPTNKWIKQSFWEVENELTFGRGAVPKSIYSVAGYLCVYGYYERAAAASVVLGRIDPLTWDITYWYARAAMEMAYFFALRAGDEAWARRVRPLLGRPTVSDLAFLEERFFPSSAVMVGLMLRLPFNDPEYGNDLPGQPADWIAADAMNDLSSLVVMWNYGGSTVWPQERIMQQIETTIRGMQSTDGCGPW
jgi:hypothetical protein